MLNVTVVERARTLAFVTLAKVKLSLGLQNTTDHDERLSELIEDVSSSVERYCGRKFAREFVTEHLEGHGHVTLSLARTPLIQIDEVRQIDDVISASGYRISDPEAGFLYREDLWDSTQPMVTWIESEQVNQPGRQDWHVDYLGGYLMPDDDFSAAVVASGTAFYLASGRFPLLVSGERVRLAGYVNVDNNGEFTVLARTETQLDVDANLVHEIPSGVVAFYCNLPGNEFLPRDLQRIVMREIRDQFRSEQRDGTIKSERIGDWAATYGGVESADVNTSGLATATERSLLRWVRAM